MDYTDKQLYIVINNQVNTYTEQIFSTTKKYY